MSRERDSEKPRTLFVSEFKISQTTFPLEWHFKKKAPN